MGIWLALPAVRVGAAFKAKSVCSGIFVGGRAAEDVIADLDREDLAALGYLRTAVDARAATVTVSAVGLVTRRAVFRDGLGCALELDGRTPPRSRTASSDPARSRRAPLAESPTPAALSAVLDRAFADPDPHRLRRTQAVVVIHRGRVEAERYAPGIDDETPLSGWSMTKTVIGALAGILVGRGGLTLDVPARVREWQGTGDPRATITIDHLLRMSSGLAFDEGMSGPGSDVMQMLFAHGDTAAFAAGKPLVAPPGTVWHYSSGTSNILARVIRLAMGDDEAYWRLPREALFDPIGMTTAVMETDATGTFVGSSFMFATARDWARLGLLYLVDGVWDSVPVLPPGWVRYMTTAAPADRSGRYGAHMWLAVPEEYTQGDCRLPAGTFHAAGHEGQFVTVVPSREAVIVRLGRTRQAGVWNHCGFVTEVLAALESQ